MRIIITGGAGFLGRKLAKALLDRTALTDASGAARKLAELVLLDVVAAPALDDPRVVTLAGDLADPRLVKQLFERPVDSIFHLAAIVSGEAERDFDLGWRVNVDATRQLLEACRRLPAPPKFVFSSSAAVFGGHLPDVVPDDQVLTPQSSYGAEKAVGEFYLHDYTRKGFVDGRALRLPTVSVRPGKPNQAASSFASGIVREPLNGIDAACPVGPETRMWLISPRRVIENLVLGHEVPANSFAHSRSINVPGISVTVGNMVASLRRVAGDAVADRVLWQHDPVIDRIVKTWPRDFNAAFGRSLGMQSDMDFDSIVRQYIDDEMRRPAPATGRAPPA